MSFKKICFFFAISCLMSCGETETKNKPTTTKAPSSKTTTPTANKQEATITPGKNGGKKITLGKTNTPPTTEAQPFPKSSTGSTSGYYQSAQHRFKIKHPQNWEKLENQKENIPVVFMNRPKGAMSKGVESISIAVEGAKNFNLDVYYNYCRNQLLNSGETTGIIEESIGKSKEGKTFKRIIFNRKPNPTPSIAVSFVFVENNITYTITGSAEDNKFHPMRALFEDVAASIEFE